MGKVTLTALGIFLLAMAGSASASGQEKPAKSGPLTGTWECSSHGTQTGERKFKLELQQDEEKVTGSVDSEEGGMDITSAKFKDGSLEIRLETPDGNYVLSAELKDGQLTGKITLDGKDHATWEGKKAAASPSKSAP
jgi:hypothetical protein